MFGLTVLKKEPNIKPMTKLSKLKKFIFFFNYLEPDEVEAVLKEFAQNSFKLGWQASVATVLLHVLAKNGVPSASIFFSAEIIVVLSTFLLDITSFQYRKLLHRTDKIQWLCLNLFLRFTFYLSLSYVLANYINDFGLVSLIGVISVGIIAAGSESIVHHAFPLPSFGIFLIAIYIAMPLYELYFDPAEGAIIFFAMSMIHFPFQIPKIMARNKMFFEKLHAKMQMEKEKEQFEILFEMIPAAISWLKRDLSYIRANQYVTNYAGKTKENFIGKKFGFTQNIDGDPDVNDFLNSDSLELTKNFAYRRHDNVYRRHRSFWKKIKNDSEIVILSVDIEDQIQARELNETLLKRMNVLMTSSKIGILFLDLQKHLVEESDEFRLITNIKSSAGLTNNLSLAEEAIPRSICYFKNDSPPPKTQLNEMLSSIAMKINPDYALQFQQKFTELITGKIKTLEFECSFHNNERGWIWTQMFFTVEKYGEANLPVSIIGYFTDITKKKEMESNLAQSTKMASLGQMATGIAYEINNPLAVISGKVRILKKQIETKNLNPELALMEIEKLESMISRIIKIIKGLKAISKEANDEELQLVPIQQIINETASVSITRFMQSDINLYIAPIPEEFKIYCKSVQISQVVLNLLNNAYDAIKDDIRKKWVSIDFAESKTQYFIYITDSGNGIPVELHDKILNPFFTTKENGKGEGLGLSISQSIMFEHKGEIGIDKSCKNTRFYLQFPKPDSRKTSGSPSAANGYAS